MSLVGLDSMYLVQRGTFRDQVNEKKKSMIDKYISFDYMGSAEFEFGALPKSYNRILDNTNDYQVTTLKITNVNGVPLNIFSRKKDAKMIEDILDEYLKSHHPRLIFSYRLKEPISFEDRVYKVGPPKYKFDKVGKDDFWWDIENDFFFFFGAKDRCKIIENAVKYDSDIRKEELKN